MKTTLPLAAAFALVATAAIAQPVPATPAHPTTTTTQAAHPDLRGDIRTSLQQAGFTDVKVVPDSFLVQAKDKAGNPITMMINPNSVTEVVDSRLPAMAGATTPPGASRNMGRAAFTTIDPGDRLSSKIVGLDIYNTDMKDIGSIKDIAYENGAIKAYIVGVGGFLGMGEHEVAVNPAAVQVTWDSQAKIWHARMNTTVDDLKAAPEFKYQPQG